jgi:predicted ribonuclease YlaK
MKDGVRMAKEKLFFYDTNAILELQEKILESKFALSSVTLHELEHIKTSKNKDDSVKYQARKAIHILDEHSDSYEVVIPNNKTFKILSKFSVEESPDSLITACAYQYNQRSPISFISNDICCRTIARDIFKLEVSSTHTNNVEASYTGYKEVKMSDTEMAEFYNHLNQNRYELLTNEYLIIRNNDDKVVDLYKWNDEEHVKVYQETAKSQYFGTVKPYSGDEYQVLAMNSMSSNKITMLKGSAGTGKSYLAIGHLFYMLEKHMIDKIIVFCNTVATANSAKLGYYTGSRDEKLLQSSIGNMLSAKLGGLFAVEKLIVENKLLILPISDIRGFDTTGMKCGVYLPECQNMDVSLMKLSLQRIGDDCICILDGDYNTQVDMSQYSGNNNGMRRVSEVFRSHDFYGEVELKNCYRGIVATIAENM